MPVPYKKPGITVRVSNGRQSHSFTVYVGPVEEVARRAEGELRKYFTTTGLSSRRHKRRL